MGYVEDAFEARMKLADFFSILLDRVPRFDSSITRMIAVLLSPGYS
jgi:hypothetical protein